MKSVRAKEERAIDQAIKKGFPQCKGTYPDCPEEPNQENPKCASCPILEAIIDDF